MKKRRFIRLFRHRVNIILLLLLQIAFIAFLLITSNRIMYALNTVMTILGAIISLRIISNDEKSGYKITWIFIILIFPLFGVSFYLIFNAQISRKKIFKKYDYIKRKADKYNEMINEENKSKKIDCFNYGNAIYLKNHVKFPLFLNQASKYLSPGELFFEELKLELQKAEKYIFMEYFIIQEGKMWNEILEILKQKVSEGVKIRIIYDDIGCFLKLPINYKKYLNKLGIECEVFNKFRPILTTQQNNRDHRKITVIDGKVAFTGGINLADEYINEKKLYGHWKDSAIKIVGDAAWEYALIFLQTWEMITNCDEDYLLYRSEQEEIKTSDGFIQPYADNPKDHENVGENVYLNMVNNAKKTLYITTPYLIVDNTLLSSIKLASKNGVDVKIITPGKYDKKLVSLVTKSYYNELIESGVKIYEYQKGFVHSKMFISDEDIATIGTTNLDFRSLYLHFECGTCLYKSEEIKTIKKDFENTLADCKKIEIKDCKKGKFKAFLISILRLFAPLM